MDYHSSAVTDDLGCSDRLLIPHTSFVPRTESMVGIPDRKTRRTDKLLVPNRLSNLERSRSCPQDSLELSSHLVHDAPAYEQASLPLIALLCE